MPFQAPYDLTVNGVVRPLAVGRDAPVLSWRLVGSGPQSTVTVEAASSRKLLEMDRADVWREVDLPLTAFSLEWPSDAVVGRVYWRVGIRDTGDGGTTWSPISEFAFAPNTERWESRWVTHESWTIAGAKTPEYLPVLRHAFDVNPGARSAMLYVSGGGVFETRVNGRLSGNKLLSPGYSTYQKRVGSWAEDVLHLLDPDQPNLLLIELGTGMAFVEELPDRYTKFHDEFMRPRVLFRLEIEYDDGTSRYVESGPGTQAAGGATSTANWYGGQDFDRRRADKLESDATLWTKASDLGPVSRHQVWWPEYPGVEEVDRLTAAKVTTPRPGVRVFDFGLNIAGVPVLEMQRGVSGESIRIYPAEFLRQDGSVDQWSTGSPIFDSYTCITGPQSWRPNLVYHGFRYLQVEGLDDTEDDYSVQAAVLRAANEKVGGFECSHPMLNQLDSMIDRAIQGNMFSVFTDCPHREKLGWIEQVELNFDALTRGYDLRAQLRDTVRHISDAQLSNGAVVNIAPEFVSFAGNEYRGDPDAFREDPNWGGAFLLIPEKLYEAYGDVATMKEHWPAMERYLGYLDGRSVGGILDFGLGDWVALDHSTPRSLVATFGYIRLLECASRIATILGHETSASVYGARAGISRRAFADTFSSNDGGKWGSDSQGSLAISLDLGVVPFAKIASVQKALVEALQANGARVSVGEVALPSLIRVLHNSGHDQLLLDMITSEGPGYGHQVRSGATALTETWTGVSGPEGEGSQNHFMLAMIRDWLYGNLAGLKQAAGSVAWAKVLIEPMTFVGIASASCKFDSPRGLYSVAWVKESKFDLRVSVPPGGSAEIRLPSDVESAYVLADDGKVVRRGRVFELTPGNWVVSDLEPAAAMSNGKVESAGLA